MSAAVASLGTVLRAIVDGRIKLNKKYRARELKKIVGTATQSVIRMLEAFGLLSKNRRGQYYTYTFISMPPAELIEFAEICDREKIPPHGQLEALRLMLRLRESGPLAGSALRPLLKTRRRWLEQHGYVRVLRVKSATGKKMNEYHLTDRGRRIASAVKKPELLMEKIYERAPEEETGANPMRVLELLHRHGAVDRRRSLTASFIAASLGIDRKAARRILEEFVSRGLVEQWHGQYYLTSLGLTFLERHGFGMARFHEHDESELAVLLNRVARKAIHVVREGMTAGAIAEEIGYDVEDWNSNSESLSIAQERAVRAVADLLDMLEAYGVVSLRRHYDPRATRVVRVRRPDVLEMFRKIAVLVEFVPTLLVEDETFASPLRLAKIDTSALERAASLDQIPGVLRGRVCSPTRTAYWVTPESLDGVSDRLVQFRNRYLIMVRKDEQCQG